MALSQTARRISTAGPLTPERLALAGILLLAIAVRLVAAGSRLNNADAYSWLVASAGSPHAFLHQLAATENTPPLFYLLLAPLPIGHEIWLRMPSVIAGVAVCVLVYWILRRRLGAGTALLAALATSASPFLVTYSDFSRGFMVEDVFLLAALAAMLALIEGASSRWWWLYLAAGTAAIYTEYDAAVFLVALVLAAWRLWSRRRRELLVLGVLPLVAVAPWIPRIVSAQHQINTTKLSPVFSGPSPSTLRETAVSLALGEFGGVRSVAAHWLELLVIIGALLAAALVLRRTTGAARRTCAVIGMAAALTLIGHAIAPAAGIEIFDQRYLTILVPLVAALGAAAVIRAERRTLVVLATVLLVGLGLANIARRWGRQWEPDYAPIRAAAVALHPRSVLTNNPAIVFYLRTLHPVLDRPFNLGPGDASSCARPCLIIDDLGTRTGPPRRLTTLPQSIIGQYELALER